MIALDTNVLLRLYTEDDPQQALMAKELVRRAMESDGVFIAFVTAVEFVWVLSKQKYSRNQISTLLEKLLHTRGIRIANAEILREAIAHYRKGKASFSDYVILAEAKQGRAHAVVSFDQLFQKEFPDFILSPKALA